MTDEFLIIQTQSYVKQERVLLKQILCNLKEIETRKLYLKRGYGSMFTFCTRALGYSESAAQRRIDAMRAFKEIPEIADKIAEGKLSLSSVAMVQKTLRRESKNKSQHKSGNFNTRINLIYKKDLFKSIECKSQREVEQVLVQKFPQAYLLNKADSTKALSSEKSEIKFIADDDLIKKLQQIRFMYSHKNSHPTYNELLHLMADQILAKPDKKRKAITDKKAKVESNKTLKAIKDMMDNKLTLDKKTKLKRRVNVKPDTDTMVKSVNKTNIRPTKTTARPEKRANLERDMRPMVNPATKVRSTAPSQRQKKLTPSRYISKSVKQELYIRDNGSCQYVDPFSKVKCNSKHLLQIDHVKAYSKGGGSRINNLQLLCAGHNQLKSDN